MKHYLILILAAFTIVSCGGGRSHPKMLSFTPASVVIDYSDNDLHEATALAQQFCSSTNKDAQYVRTEENGLVFKESKAFFNCVLSEKHYNQNTGGAGSNIPIINNFK